jgi:hypothetical protein
LFRFLMLRLASRRADRRAILIVGEGARRFTSEPNPAYHR